MNDSYDDSSSDRAVQQLAQRIVELRLQTPALFFLELHKPLLNLAHTTCLLFQPVAAPLFGAERVATLERLLSSQEQIEKLCRLIEELSQKLEK